MIPGKHDQLGIANKTRRQPITATLGKLYVVALFISPHSSRTCISPTSPSFCTPHDSLPSESSECRTRGRVSFRQAGYPASNDITKLDKSINAMFIKEEEVRGKISKLRDAIVVFADLIKVELGKNEQRSKFLVDAVKQMRQENDVSSKALQDKLKVMNKSPQKKVVTHRFEPTSKSVLLFIGGMALSLVLSIWGNLTQWREHQDWEEADLKYRALKMVLPSDDPNVRYIEKNFSVCPNKEVIENVRAHVNTYEDSIRYHIEMIQMAAIKDSIANSLFKEANEIKKKINKR